MKKKGKIASSTPYSNHNETDFGCRMMMVVAVVEKLPELFTTIL